MEKNRSIPWHFTLSDDDYTTTSEDNNSSECIDTHKRVLIIQSIIIIYTISMNPFLEFILKVYLIF